jgi:hypothetical protein
MDKGRTNPKLEGKESGTVTSAVTVETNSIFQSIPLEVKYAVPLLNSASNEVVECALRKTIELVKGSPISDQHFLSLASNLNIDEDEFGTLFTGLYVIFSSIVRKKVSQSRVREDLCKIGVTPAVADVICSAFRPDTRIPLVLCLKSQAPGPPSLIRMNWRVDVILSSGSLSKVMRPAILMKVAHKISRFVFIVVL